MVLGVDPFERRAVLERVDEIHDMMRRADGIHAAMDEHSWHGARPEQIVARIVSRESDRDRALGLCFQLGQAQCDARTEAEARQRKRKRWIALAEQGQRVAGILHFADTVVVLAFAQVYAAAPSTIDRNASAWNP